MDINYLLFLQHLREITNNVFSPFLIWMSDFATGFWPVAMICMIFWAFDRKAGRRIMAGFGLGVLANGVLKLTFRITRPWLRDARVVPYGDAITHATGYSFPSGHSTFATSLFGGTGLWLRKKGRKVLAGVLFLAMVLTFFSRNYLGVHTPQDVFVGFASTALMMFAASKIEDWTDADPKRDIYVMIAGLALCAVLFVYYTNIHITPVYDAAGNLAVDPVKMVADAFEGIGFISAFCVCRFFERRHFHFDTEKSWKDRFVIGVFALVPLYVWCVPVYEKIKDINRFAGKFGMHAGIAIYALIIVPFVMSKIHIPAHSTSAESVCVAE